MSYDVTLRRLSGDELFWRNYTSNTSRMWKEAGVDLRNYHAGPARALRDALAPAIAAMFADPAKFEAMEPANGWGDFTTTVDFLVAIWRACNEYPYALVEVSS